MCIVIDTNTLGSVFDITSANHQEFKPVYDWIVEGAGKIVYGGTKYKTELGKYLSIFSTLRAAKQAIYIPDNEVDASETVVVAAIKDDDFDDQHLVALLLVSKCKLICSLDKRAYKYFRNKVFFSPASKKPKIYSNKANAHLLSNRNIAEVCKPSKPTTKAEQAMISNIHSILNKK